MLTKLNFMKNLLLTIPALLVSSILFSQGVQVTEQQSTFSSGEKTALTVTIQNNSKDKIVDLWKNNLKEFKSEKIKTDKNEMFADNVLIPEWGNNPIDIYSAFQENKDGGNVKMMVAFDLGGAYLSKETDSVKYNAAVKIVKDFAVKANRYPFEERIIISQKLIQNMEDDQKSLESKNKDLAKDIEDYKNKISKSEEEIRLNEESLGKKKALIQAEKANHETIKSDMEKIQ